MPKPDSDMVRVRRLELEIEALAASMLKAPTYHKAVQLQCRTAERDAIIDELRSRIRVVVDNSEFWG